MKYTNESGRSMVEMLGVLAIIGVLSVGGIAGYSKAMNKFKINKTTDQVSMLVANIRTIYSTQGNYDGLDNANAISFGVIPNDMIKTSTDGSGKTSTDLRNAFGGSVIIAAAEAREGSYKEAFTIEYNGLSDEACVTLATGDWGSGQSSGLLGVAAKKGGSGTAVADKATAALLADAYTTGKKAALTGDGQAVAVPGGIGADATPMPVTKAVAACAGGGTVNSVAWKYY